MLLAVIAMVGALQLHAAPGFFQAATQADFLRGDVENLSIDEHGRLMLGPELARLHDPEVPFIWSMISTADETLYLGTGSEGRVLRVEPNGRARVFFDSAEMAVHALAAAPNGGLYVATSPEGRIYRVDSQGQATTFFDPEDKYIWSLAVDGKGNVYASTGDKGVVYRIAPDGTSKPFFSTKTTHATVLTFDRSGPLLVGTGAPGRVFRVDADGRGFLLLDTSYQEIRSLRFDERGTLFVAAQSGRPGSGGDSGDAVTPDSAVTALPIPSVSTEITAITIIDTPVGPRAPAAVGASDRRGPTGAVFRVLPDGLWDLVWESRDDAPYDIAIDADGTLLVATGGKGKIFRLTGDPLRPTLLTRVAAQQAAIIHRRGDRTVVATANPGLLLTLSPARAERGTYESEVKDARSVATWGSIAWRATTPSGTDVEVQTRSGNTRTPDEAWSDWSKAYQHAVGSPITSPKSRYLQWRAVLRGERNSPILTSVMAAYQQRNIRPEVVSITVHPPGVVFKKPFSSGETEIAGYEFDIPERRLATAATGIGGSSVGQPTYQKGLQSLIWKAEDDNGDELNYEVLYRREGETAWKLLKSDLTDTILVWDTSSTPNGAYVVKVVASDAQSHPAENALRGERESASFDIDNGVPVVTLSTSRREASRIVVPFVVRDADSAIARVEYSVDSQRWQSVFPIDGILDGRHEEFLLRLDPTLSGRTLVVRARDGMHNVGSGEIVVK